MCASSHFVSFFVAFFFKSSLNRDKTVAVKVAVESTNPSQLELEPTDGVACRHSVFGGGESERKARTANQLVLMSPVAKKHGEDQPIRTGSTESITDWANRMGAIGFLPILNAEA